ncbi:MAG: SusE domain-containing protein [Bacteroidales bacterium]|nr:SusE domain-containing protein [Bacteroidales bacterium]
MKNILNIFIAGVAALVLSSCVDESFVQYNPEDVVAPVLSSLPASSYVLEAGMDFATFTYSEASFGVPTAIRYTVYADLAGNDFAGRKSIGTTDGSTSITVAASDMNNVLIGMDLQYGLPYDVEFKVIAAMKGESNVIDGYTVESNVITATVTPYEAEKELAKLYVLGSFNGWSHDKALFLWNYEEDDVEYQGVIDFGEDHSSNEFKMTDAPDWNHGDFGTSDTNPEADQITLVSGGGNITLYTTYRYYHFTGNPGAMTLKRNMGFDEVTVTVGGASEVMTYYSGSQRFYADMAGASGTVTVSIDGSAYATQEIANADDYRIYFDMNDLNNAVVTYSAAAYGTEEGAGDGDEGDAGHVFDTFMLSGEMTDGWANLEMTALGNEIYVAYSIDATAGQNYGFNDLDNVWWAAWEELDSGNGSHLMVIGEETPCDNWNGPHGSVNCEIPSDGTFDFWVMANLGVHYLMNAGDVPAYEPDTYGLVGTINGWGAFGDLAMTEENGYHVRKRVTLVDGDSFKIRYNNEWDDSANYGTADGATYPVNEAIPVVSAGSSQNIVVNKTGIYDIYFDIANLVVWVMAEGYLPGESPATWGLCGTINNWGGTDDLAMTEEDGIYYRKGVNLAVDDEFKLRYDNDWSAGDYGTSDAFAVGTALWLTAGGSNVKVTIAGIYDIYFDSIYERLFIMEEGDEPDLGMWGLCGTINDWGGTDDLALKMEDGLYVCKGVELTTSDEFKLRYDNDWSAGDYGTSDAFAIDVPLALEAGGGNISVTIAGTYDIYVDFDNLNLYVEEEGDKPTL